MLANGVVLCVQSIVLGEVVAVESAWRGGAAARHQPTPREIVWTFPVCYEGERICPLGCADERSVPAPQVNRELDPGSRFVMSLAVRQTSIIRHRSHSGQAPGAAWSAQPHTARYRAAPLNLTKCSAGLPIITKFNEGQLSSSVAPVQSKVREHCHDPFTLHTLCVAQVCYQHAVWHWSSLAPWGFRSEDSATDVLRLLSQ